MKHLRLVAIATGALIVGYAGAITWYAVGAYNTGYDAGYAYGEARGGMSSFAEGLVKGVMMGDHAGREHAATRIANIVATVTTKSARTLQAQTCGIVSEGPPNRARSSV